MLSTGARPREHRLRGARGSALMLVPATVLILFVLGAIAVDLTAIHLGQRDLQAALTDAANDAAAGALDEGRLRAGLGYRVDEDTAWLIAMDVLATKGVLRDVVEGPTVEVAADGNVTITAARRVPHVFGRALPGVSGHETVRATATATLERR